jgi:hypothetical protein
MIMWMHDVFNMILTLFRFCILCILVISFVEFNNAAFEDPEQSEPRYRLITDEECRRLDNLGPDARADYFREQYLLLHAFNGWLEETFGPESD